MDHSDLKRDSMEDNYVTEFESQEPDFYARIPKMAIMELNPYELALYCNYKQTASEGGKCFKSNETLAKETGMGISKLQQVRYSLETKGYIQVQRHQNNEGHDFRPPTIMIVNVWAKNHDMYTGGMVRDTTPVVSGITPVVSHTTKEEPYKKNQEESLIPDAGDEDQPTAGEYREETAALSGDAFVLNHDLSKLFMKEFGLTNLTKVVKTTMTSTIEINADEVGGKSRPFYSLIWHWDNVLGFQDFVKTRFAQIKMLPNRMEPEKALKNLTYFGNRPVKGKGWPGWLAWKEAHPELCSELASEPEVPPPIYIDPT